MIIIFKSIQDEIFMSFINTSHLDLSDLEQTFGALNYGKEAL